MYPSDKHWGHPTTNSRESGSLISKAHKIVKQAFNMGQLKGSFDDEEKRRKRMGNWKVVDLKSAIPFWERLGRTPRGTTESRVGLTTPLGVLFLKNKADGMALFEYALSQRYVHLGLLM
jgi:hypothetical protein